MAKAFLCKVLKPVERDETGVVTRHSEYEVTAQGSRSGSKPCFVIGDKALLNPDYADKGWQLVSSKPIAGGQDESDHGVAPKPKGPVRGATTRRGLKSAAGAPNESEG